MKKLAWAGILSLAALLSAPAAMVQNGGFETGDLSDWASIPIAAVVGNSHSGSYAARLGPAIGLIAQNVSVVAGQKYQVDFWARDNGASVLTPQVLTVSLGLIPGNVASFDPTSTYTHYSFQVMAPLTGSLPLSFGWLDGLRMVYIDDIAMSVVPEPSTYLAGALLALPLALGALRRRFSGAKA